MSLRGVIFSLPWRGGTGGGGREGEIEKILGSQSDGELKNICNFLSASLTNIQFIAMSAAKTGSDDT